MTPTHIRTHTWVVVDEALVDAGQLLTADVAGGARRRLEVQVILALYEELGGGDVHPYHHLVGEAGLLYGSLQQLQG